MKVRTQCVWLRQNVLFSHGVLDWGNFGYGGIFDIICNIQNGQRGYLYFAFLYNTSIVW